MTDRPLFEIGAEGIDAAAIVAEIQATVADKMARGLYTDPRIARAERTNLACLQNEERFLAFYLECLREAVFVDINDFEIQERRPGAGRLLVALKKVIWKLLKFYTYRLWSQQNQVNGVLLSAIEGIELKYRDKIRELEAQIAELRNQRSV